MPARRHRHCRGGTPVAKGPGLAQKEPGERGCRARANTEPFVTETVAEILSAYRRGAAKPEDVVARSFARIRAHADPAMFIALREETEAVAEARALARAAETRCRSTASRLRSRTTSTRGACRQRRRARLSPTSPRQDADRRRAAAARRRARHRQDQSRSVCDRPRRRALALWHSAQPVRSGADSRRVELGLGGRGRRGAGAARARHRHGGIGPRAGRVQQHRRPQAEPRARLGGRRRAGLPHARLRVDFCADHRRCVDRARPRSPAPMLPIRYSRARARCTRSDRCRRTAARRADCAGSACSSAIAPRQAAYAAALADFAALGAQIVEIDIEPFYEAARLLYEGPWVAERYPRSRALIASSTPIRCIR